MESKGRIGIIVPHICSNVDTEFIDIIHTNAAEYGYDTLVVSGVINYQDDTLEWNYGKGQMNIYHLITHGKFDGFIFEANIFCSDIQRHRILDMLNAAEIPCVVVNYEQPFYPVVSADETSLLYFPTKHLIEKHGCRKIYCIGGYRGHLPSEERISGFRKAMDEKGISYDEKSIFYGDYWRDIPKAIALKIVSGEIDKPDGIVCGSDIMAVSVMHTLIENGIKVPEEIKVTGCDGNITALMNSVSVTTVAGQERINGFLAITKLLKVLGNEICDSEMKPELIIGESCGCGESGGFYRNRSLSDIKEYSASLLEIIEHRKTNSHGEIIRRMSESKNIYDVISTFVGCCYMIPTGIKAELCLCEDWCRDMNDPSIYRTSDLSDNMLLAVDACDPFGPKMNMFMTKDIFPSLKTPHEPRLTVISSIHYKDQIFGYVGFTYRKAVHIVFDEFYMSWCDSLSSGLNIVQNRMYKEYVNKRIETLSEFAPVLGIYNKRGLIGKLMNLMAENSNTVFTLTLLSYIREDRVRYSVPPINSIVNAIRISDDQAVLASIDEDIIAVVKPLEKIEFNNNSFAHSIADTVRESYRGALEIKPDRIAFLSDSFSAADIFSIEERMGSLEDKLKGIIISHGSGTLSYKESFISLRENIFDHPEKDWNIEMITHEIGVSKSHFHRIYRELFGTSCKDDIITSRIDKVKWLLENTSLSISQISEQCGYSNTSHFIRQFSSRTGMTPSAYRRKNEKKTK